MPDSAVHKAFPGRPFATIVQYNRPYWKEYGAGAALAVLFVGISLLMPMVFRAVVARLEAGTMTSSVLWAFFGVLVLIAAISGVARYLQRCLMVRASRKFEYDLRNDYFRHVQQLSQDFFHRMQTGDIMARATNDLNYVRMFIGPGIMGTVDLLRLPLTLAMMTYLSAKLTAIALIPLPIISLLVYSFVSLMHRQSKRVQDQFAVVTSRAQENLAGARVVKAYGVATREVDAFKNVSQTYMRESIKLSAIMAFTWPFLGLVMGVTALLVVWRGGLMVVRGSLAFADFSAHLFYVVMLAMPLARFGWTLTLYQRGAAGMNRLLEVFSETPSIQDDEQTQQHVASIRGAVRFEEVSFAYDKLPVLHHVDFYVEAGQTLAIVGLTGSGKSSIVSLLTREYDPTEGRILIDDVDARRLPVSLLRSNIGYVPQETFLFSDTIRANLTLGRPNATPEEIERALNLAQLRETVEEMPEGVDTLLGERGVNLSGGQKQRLAIARAAICDPRVLILDDALSSVDTHTEELILSALKQFLARRTSIIIAHRISTVQHADLILVVDDG
ncbi:MAG TPA: ABC transporter ATP-binding protein, partial [Candidatus Hydrogenedentes bacterium]|nr:ABC transporter ATP-binding protein [Candidatus Hydrogenedentota bacterium]